MRASASFFNSQSSSSSVGAKSSVLRSKQQQQQATSVTQHQRQAANKSIDRRRTSQSDRRSRSSSRSSSSDSSRRRRSNKMSSLANLIMTTMTVLALVMISISTLNLCSAKPLNQNQVKFRRIPPKEFSALQGSGITIECEAGSSPPPTIHWLKNGRMIAQSQLEEENLLDDGGQPLQQQQGRRPLLPLAPPDEVNRISLSSTRSRLFIDCADTDDEAVYTCVADNAFSRISTSTKLNLIKPVASLQMPASETNLLAPAAAAAAGDEAGPAAAAALSALPQCLSQRNSRSSEPARIHMWTHNIVEIMKNDVILYCRSNVRRQPPSRVQQQQQQQEALVAAVAAAVEQATATEQTLSDLLSSNKLTVASNSPTSSDNTQQQQQQQLDNSSGSSSGSKASVSWTLPDDKLVSQEDKDKFEILETGDLLIKDLRWSDMGSYVCTASNELGSDSVSTFVYPAAVKASKNKRAPL